MTSAQKLVDRHGEVFRRQHEKAGSTGMKHRSRLETIEIAQIRLDHKSRPIAPSHVNELADGIERTLFASAVIVCPISGDDGCKWQLISGFHRIAAAEQKGLDQVPAIVIEDASPEELELIRIDENLGAAAHACRGGRADGESS